MLKLISEQQISNSKEVKKIYNYLEYAIVEITTASGYKILNIYSINGEYYPKIYTKEDYMKCKILGFEIQTTSYGSLESGEIEKIIEGYQTALKVVKELEKKYL